MALARKGLEHDRRQNQESFRRALAMNKEQQSSRFWAHSDPDGRALDAPGSRAQLLAEHLAQVSKLAAELAFAAAPDDLDSTRWRARRECSTIWESTHNAFRRCLKVGRGGVLIPSRELWRAMRTFPGSELLVRCPWLRLSRRTMQVCRILIDFAINLTRQSEIQNEPV